MTNRLKIGQEVLIHGYVDEIRKDTIIIRNEGGYFGTVEYEVTDIEIPNTNEVLDKIIFEIEEYKSRKLSLAIGVSDLETGKHIALESVIAIIDRYRTEGGDKE